MLVRALRWTRDDSLLTRNDSLFKGALWIFEIKLMNGKSRYSSFVCIPKSVFEFIVVLRHMHRYFSHICHGTDVQADWRRSCTYGRAPNAIVISQGSLTCPSYTDTGPPFLHGDSDTPPHSTRMLVDILIVSYESSGVLYFLTNGVYIQKTKITEEGNEYYFTTIRTFQNYTGMPVDISSGPREGSALYINSGELLIRRQRLVELFENGWWVVRGNDTIIDIKDCHR